MMKKFLEFLGLGYYTSELDQFLAEFDAKHPELSFSQRQEIEKYTRIFQLRDEAHLLQTQTSLWDQF